MNHLSMKDILLILNSTAAALVLSFSFSANAQELKIDSSEINGKCRVMISKGVLTITSPSGTRPEFSHPFTIREQLGPAIEKLSGSDYPGTMVAYLETREKSILVTATWEDGEAGDDQASFCEIER